MRMTSEASRRQREARTTKCGGEGEGVKERMTGRVSSFEVQSRGTSSLPVASQERRQFEVDGEREMRIQSKYMQYA